MRLAIRLLFLSSTAALALGCPQKESPKDAGAPSASVSAPATSSAVSAGPEPQIECAAAECTVKSITERGKEKLEKQPNHQELLIVFGKGATNADLKTLALVPWVTNLRIASEEITDTFGVDELKDLKKLDIGASHIKSLAGLARLSNLVTFDAKGLSTLEDITALAKHTNLAELNVSGTPLADIKPLWNTPNLVSLDLKGTKVEDIQPLKKCTKLESVDLSDTKVKDVEPLSEAKEMKKLVLANAPVGDVDALKSLVKVETLDLSGTKIRSLDGLKEMKRLQTLNLNKAKNVTDFKALVRCTNIAVLDATGTNVQDVGPLVVMKKMKVLHLTGTRVMTIMTLSAVTDLEELFLAGTYVQDLAPIAGLKKLRRVVVGKNFPKAKIEAFKKLNAKVEVTVEGS